MAESGLNIKLKLQPEIAVDQINVILSQLKKSLGELGKGIELLDAAAIEKEMKKVADSGKVVSTQIETAKDEADELVGSLNKAGSEASLFTKAFKFNQITQGIATLTGAFDQFLGPYKEFDAQLKNIGTLGVKNFEEFRNAAIDLASSVPDTVAGVTEGVYNAISAGAIKLTADGIADVAGGMQFVEQASKLAVAGMTDTNAAIQGLSAVTNAYGPEVLSAANASDILFGTVKNGVTTVPAMNAALSNVVPIAAAAGVSFEQVGGAIATLTKQGVPTAQATTQMRAAIAELLKPGASLKKVMEEAGVSLETLKQDGLQETMRKLGVAMSTLGTDSANTFSSIEAVGFSLATTGDNATKAASDLEAIKNSAGSVNEAFAVANQGIGVQVQGYLNQIEAVAFKAFGAIGDGAVVAIDSINQIAPTVTTFAGLGTLVPDSAKQKIKDYGKELQKLPGILSNMKGPILEFGKSAASMVPGGDSIKKFATTLITTLVPSFATAGTAGTTAGASTAAAWSPVLVPILAVAAGLAAVGAAFAYFYNTNESFKNVVDTVWGGLKEALSTIFDVISDGASLIGSLLVTAFDVAILPLTIFIETLSQLSDSLFGTSVVFGDVSGIMDTFGGFVEGIADKIRLFIDINKALISGVSSTISVVTEGIGGTVASLLTGDLIGAGKKFFSMGSDMAGAFQDGVDASISQSSFDRLTDKLDEDLKDAEDINVNVQANADFGNLISQYEALESQITDLELIPQSERSAQEEAQLESLRDKAQGLANQIAETNSAAVTGTKSVFDKATGELVTSYDISTAKAKELYEAQKQIGDADLQASQDAYSSKLKATVDIYEDQKQKLREMQDEANALAESGDTEGAQEKIAEINEFTKQVTANQEEVQKLLNEGTKAGIIDIPTSVLAKQSLGIEVDIDKETVDRGISDMQKILQNNPPSLAPKVDVDAAISEYEKLDGRIKELRERQSSGDLDDAQAKEVEAQIRALDGQAAAIANTIGRMSVDSRENVKLIVDENGNLVETFDLNIDKAKEFADANRESGNQISASTEEYSGKLSEVAKIYTAQKSQLEDIKARAIEAAEAGDPTKARELQAEYTQLKTKVDQYGLSLAQSYKNGNDQGLVLESTQEEIRKAFEATDEEIADMVSSQKEFTDEVESTADAAKSLGEAFESSLKKAQDTQKASLTNLAGIQKELAAARKEGDKEEIARLEGLEKQEADRLKTSTAQVKADEAIVENLEYQYGLKEKKEEKVKSILERTKEQFGIEQKQLDRELKSIEHQRELAIIADGRKKNQYDELLSIDDANAKRQKELDLLKEKFKLEFDEEGNVVDIGIRLNKDEAKNKAKIVDDLKNQVADIEASIANDELAKLRINAEIKGNPLETLKKQIEINERSLTVRSDLKLVPKEATTEEIVSVARRNMELAKSELQRVNNELQEFLESNGLQQGAVLADLPPELANRYKAILDEQEQYEDLALDQTVKFNKAGKDLMAERLENIRAANDAEQEELDISIEKRKASLELLNEITADSISSSIDKEEQGLSDKFEKDKARLDKLKESELISEKAHKAKLERIERDHNEELEKLAKKRELIQSLNEGARFEQERTLAIEKLNLQKEGKEKELEVLGETLQERQQLSDDSFDTLKEKYSAYLEAQKKLQEDDGNDPLATKELQKSLNVAEKSFNEFNDSLKGAKLNKEDLNVFKGLLEGISDAETEIGEKSDLIAQYGGKLESGLTEAFSNIGDPEAMKESFRGMFGVMAGALKQKAQAAITDMLLDYFITSSLNPLVAILGAAAIKGLVGAAINGIMSPVLSGLASFAEGGRVDHPTLAIVGDKSKAVGGTKDTEWVLHDTHIAQIIAKHDKAIAEWVGKLIKHEDLQRHMDKKMILKAVIEGAGRDMPSDQSSLMESTLLRHTMSTLTNEVRKLTPALMKQGYPNVESYFSERAQISKVKEIYIRENKSKEWLDTRIQEIRVPRYAFGSPALTSPQLAIVGDNPREPERVVTDSRLREMMEMVSGMSNEKVVGALSEIREELVSFSGRLHFMENDVYRANNNQIRKANNRKKK